MSVSRSFAGTLLICFAGLLSPRRTGPVSPAQRSARLAVPQLLAAEPVPLNRAAGRILAEPVRAAVMLPGFDNAAMGGYAVAGHGPWRLTGRVLVR